MADTDQQTPRRDPRSAALWSSGSRNSPTRTCTRCARRPSAAIIDGGGFGWVNAPGRLALETYFRGVLLVPERELFVARLNGIGRRLRASGAPAAQQ